MQSNKILLNIKEYVLKFWSIICKLVRIGANKTKNYTIKFYRFALKYTIIGAKKTLLYLQKAVSLIKKVSIIVFLAIRSYLNRRIFIRRVLAKIIDIIAISLILVFALIVVIFVEYLVVINMEIIMTVLRNLTIFITLIITLFLSIIYFTYFAFGRKLLAFLKESSEKTYYSEPIFHFNIFLIYACIMKYFMPNTNIKVLVIIFLLIYVCSFIYNGGFWNKKTTLKRRVS